MKQGRPAEKFFHRSFSLSPEKERFFAFFPVLLLFLVLVPEYFFRDLWFDEALTIINFALKESPAAIYKSYFIPNNQIIHTILIHCWMQLSGFLLLRLPALLCALGTLVVLWRMRYRFGSGVMCAALTALAVSVPFLNYGTAVRGYMLSALCSVLALRPAMDAMRLAKVKDFIIFFIFSLLALGTMPGSLAALAAVVLYAVPSGGSRFYLRKRFYLLALIPPAALLVFYFPIREQMLRAMKLGEGWSDPGEALLAVYAGMAYTFAALLIPALSGFFCKKFSGRKLIFAVRTLIWLLPFAAVMILPTAPFPRVFFPMFPIFVLLLASGVTHLRSVVFLKYGRRGAKIFIALIFCLIAGYGFFAQSRFCRMRFSHLCSGSGDDDYIWSHYLRDDYRPAETVQLLIERYPEALPPVFMSLSADPWALLFVLAGNGYSSYHCYFDGPRGKVGEMPQGSLIIIRRSENAADCGKRFNMRMEKLFESTMHGVYILR